MDSSYFLFEISLSLCLSLVINESKKLVNLERHDGRKENA